MYAHPAANGRSRGAALSDLFWYWLSPGPELHQEHLEPGHRYDEVALTTRRLLARPRATVAALAADCTARVLDERPIAGMRLVRLRDLVMPIWAEFAYELVFGERCPRRARELIVGNANDVVTALKCTGLRHMGRRHRLTRYLVDQLEHGTQPLQPLPAGLSTRERALYLQGAFFNTAVVQMSEATAHLLMVLAQQPEAQERAAAEPEDAGHLDRVLDETLRLYPLFGIAHRITSADIAVDGHTIPPGSVLCFNYPAYHRTGYDDPDAFRPERWEDLSHRDADFIPFGVAGNRPCPARGIAPVAIQAATREVLRRFALASSASHTRSIPNRGPCVLVSRTARPEPRLRLRLLLAFVRVRDRWEDVWRSLVQLVLGTYMVWDARRLRLCERHFEAADEAVRSPAARPRGRATPRLGDPDRMSHPAPATTLAQVLAPAAVEFPTLHHRHRALLELVRRLLGVVPNCDPYLEIWPTAFRTYNVMVPNLLNLPFFLWGIGAPKTPVGLAMYASSRAASCMYCSAHTASFALRRGAAESKVAERGRGAATEAERAAVAVAEAISLVPARLTDAERDALLRSLSRGDAEWVVLAVAMMGFLNKTMDALGVELEAATVDEVGPLIGRSGWSAGRHRIVPTPGGAVPARADGLALKLGLMRFLPSALALDRRWTAGVPSRWPAVGEYLSAHTGHDFPVLRHLTHRRATRAIATMLRDNGAPSRSHIGLDVKHRAGLVYATVVEDDGLAQEHASLPAAPGPATSMRSPASPPSRSTSTMTRPSSAPRPHMVR